MGNWTQISRRCFGGNRPGTIAMQVENWEDQKDWTVTFWLITAGLISLLLLFGFIQKLTSSRQSSDV
jgi:hypothetical protein